MDALRPAADAARQGGHEGPDRGDLGGRADRVEPGIDRGLHPSPASQARDLGPGDPHGTWSRLLARGRSLSLMLSPFKRALRNVPGVTPGTRSLQRHLLTWLLLPQ